MKCPYCKNEMDPGFLPATKLPLYWLPESSSTSLSVISKPKDGIQLTKFPMWTTQKARSFYCRKCEIVILPVNKNL